jgi:tyrosine-protein kinase Etk/Wzc
MSTPDSLGSQANQPPNAANEINLIDWFIALANRKKLVLGLPILFAIVAGLASLGRPNIYQATTTILPSQQSQSNATATVNQLSGLGGSTPGALSIRIPVDLYISMLRSSTVADNLIQRFDLKKAYGKDNLETTRQMLRNSTAIHSGSDGLIAITVQDREPKRAAQIANVYVQELLTLTNRLALTEASHRRLFYQRRVEDAKAKLAETEVELRSGSVTQRIKPMDSRRHAVVETAARIRAQIAAKEIELAAMQTFVSINNQAYIRGHQELGAMQAELASLKDADAGADSNLGRQVGSSNARIEHDLVYYRMLYQLLEKQYEAARIDEAKDSSIIQILDQAVEPESSAGPKPTSLVILFTILGLFIAIFWVLLFDVIQIGKLLRKTGPA